MIYVACEGRSSHHGRSRKLLSSETRETRETEKRPEAADQLDTNTPLAEGEAEPAAVGKGKNQSIRVHNYRVYNNHRNKCYQVSVSKIQSRTIFKKLNPLNPGVLSICRATPLCAVLYRILCWGGGGGGGGAFSVSTSYTESL